LKRLGEREEDTEMAQPVVEIFGKDT